MSQKTSLTQEELKSQISYDPLTGNFYRISRVKGSNAPLGLITTNPTEFGYIRIRVLGKKYMAHRLAYLYMKNAWPEQIDHKDQNRSNNRWDNLVESTDALNRKNLSRRASNNTGVSGVIWDKQRQRYVVRITYNYKQHWLGQFKTLPEAIAAREAANRKFNFSENHGKTLCKYKR